MNQTPTSELFVSLRVEELPASMVRPALQGLVDGLKAILKGIEYGQISTWATPRRLAVSIADVAQGRPVSESVVTGPPADRAIVDGQYTKAAIGFARGKGLTVDDLEVIELPKRGKVIGARVRTGGEQAVDLVREGLTQLIASIPFKKSMTWGNGTLTFGRPLHGIIALYGGEVINGEAWGITVGNTTVGHRLTPGPLTVDGSESWLSQLREHHVEPDMEIRKQSIRTILSEISSDLGSDPIEDEDLLEEVTHLVEWPVRVVGQFDEELLELPPRLLVTAMKVHQRYFPIFENGKLTSKFAVISNNPFASEAVVAEGNARVIRARFYDARFFFAEDQQKSLEAHGELLPRMRWIRGLGTMADKAARVSRLAETLAPTLCADPAMAKRAGALSKSDLVTQMVGEFPELQGHMGRLYAQAEGEPEAVAIAIEEAYLPRFAGDAVAESAAGVAVAIAERLDTLVGAFGVGMQPKGGDPQGLRRAALGVVNTLLHHGYRVELRSFLNAAIEAFHGYVLEHPEGHDKWTKLQGTADAPSGAAELIASLERFLLARFVAAKVSSGASSDLVDAVMAARGDDTDLAVLEAKVAALTAVAGTPEFLPVMHTFKRVLNISKEADEPAPSASDCTVEVETNLLLAAQRAAASVTEASASLEFDRVVSAVLELGEPVAHFFDGVMVNADDPKERQVRLGILCQVGQIFNQFADFSRISTR